MKILVVGDIHNNFNILNQLINRRRPDLVLACGDFGLWPAKPWAQPFSDIKPQGAKILWCDGNHEDHWFLRDRDTDELVPNVFYMPRGSTYILPDCRTIMFMGGADSIDKQYRTEGDTWFREEIITQKDLYNLPDIKVDIFITHTCPNELLPTMLQHNSLKLNDPSNEALTQLWKQYNPSLWIFGHWHVRKNGILGNTKWHCLADVGFGNQWWMELPK